MELQIISLFLLFLIAISIVYLSSVINENIIQPFELSEGFVSEENQVPGAVQENKGIIQWITNKDLYDTFYANVYDQLTQGSVRTQAEVGLMLHEWTRNGEKVENFNILDAGCGTGIACAALAKIGVKKIIGVDSSDAMLNHAKSVVIPQSTLTEDQKKSIEWRKGDLIDPSIIAGGEVDHAFLMYFTIYYFNDKETLFRNLYHWIKPGGSLIIHVVNKHKFDPMLESAAPWTGFSLQKYSKDRITKSEVTFDKFKYIGEFNLHDPDAEFRETFRFSNGTVRRQKHVFLMEDIDEIVGKAKIAGWKYKGFVDLTPIQLEYFYHLCFTK